MRNSWVSGLKPAFSLSGLPAIIALLVMAAGGLYAELMNNRLHQQNMRNDVASYASLVRAQLEGHITANIQLIRGLVAVISTEPDMDQKRFAELAGELFESSNQLRNVAAAPDMVISLMYPIEGNEAAIGLDYMKTPEQRDAAVRVRDTGRLILAGPVDLVQGGTGFIGRFPVYTRGPGGGRQFWGIVSAVLKADKVYADGGLLADTPVRFALRGKDATGALGDVFYGDPAIFEDDPVTAQILLPDGSWQLAAIPESGWSAAPPNQWLIRLVTALAGLLVVLPIFFAGRFHDDRAVHLKRLCESEAELKKLSDKLEFALKVGKLGVWERNISTGDFHSDARACEILGLPARPMRGTDEQARRMVHPDDWARVEAEARAALVKGEPFSIEFRVNLRKGGVRHVRSFGSAVGGPDGDARLVGVNIDITNDVERNEQLRAAQAQTELRNKQLEAAKARIEHNAMHDALTGLPNRRFLSRVLEERNMAAARGEGYAVLHIDLDRFKQINDSHGHAVGDAMLVHSANVLLSSTRPQDCVARIGGDEFVIVCGGNPAKAHLEALAADIVSKMRRPVMHEGRECRFGVSVGIASESNPRDDVRQVLINADIALYQAKRKGRNGYRFFTEELHKVAVRTKRLSDEILAGLDRGEFLAHYQPQFNASTRELVGLEALARWNHPERGLLSPAVFLEIAEDLNVVGDLDSRILSQVLEQRQKWKKAGVEIPRIAVNVSARRLHDDNLIASLKSLDIEPGAISFELVESIYLDNSSDLVLWNLDQIRELGIDLELDDFGTGHTSIVSLMKLRPSRLKIDRQLVQPLTYSQSQRELVRSIIHIGKSLGIEALAEGVETAEHARIAEQLGASALQGYALARPMSAGQITRFVRNYEPVAA